MTQMFDVCIPVIRTNVQIIIYNMVNSLVCDVYTWMMQKMLGDNQFIQNVIFNLQF